MNQNDIAEPVIPAFAGMTGEAVIPPEAGIHDAL